MPITLLLSGVCKVNIPLDFADRTYNVNNYSNEEDFYYDHYDDFFDYEDAEKYYKEHRK